MAISKFHQEHPEEYRAYNYERCKKYRMENPDIYRKCKDNEKAYDEKYREEHREEIRNKAREENRKSLENATNKGKWTEEEIKQLETLIKDGKSYKEIAEIMKRSIKSIQHGKRTYLKDLITEQKKCMYYDVAVYKKTGKIIPNKEIDR